MTYEELLIDYMVKVLQQRIFTELEQTRYVKADRDPEKYPYTCEESRRPGRRNGPLPHGCRPDH